MANHPKKSSPVSPAQARLAVVRHYQALQLEWSLELQNPSTDWECLLFLHYKIADLERRAPWLKQEVLDETC
jgi:hypothetical protein